MMHRSASIFAICGSLLVASIVAAGCASQQAATPAALERRAEPARTQTPAARGLAQVDGQVVANGRVVPMRVIDLSFPAASEVAEVLVAEGDRVQQGTPLARSDARALQLQLDEARAALALAQAAHDQALAGPDATQLAAARATLEQAQGQLRQLTGDATQQDLAAAEAQRAGARARLAELLAGPRKADVQVARAAVEQATAHLQAERDRLAAEKTAAQLQIEQAANAVRDRQAEYSQAVRQARVRNDPALQDEVDRAMRAVQNAQGALEQAQLVYEQAKKAEVGGINEATAQVSSAQAQLDALLAGPGAAAVADARAAVAQADAGLARLQGEQSAARLAAANAEVARAQAELNRLLADPPPDEVAASKAQLQTAQLGVQRAELELDNATLRAPIAGTITRLNIMPGARSNGQIPDIVLADLSQWQIETAELTEIDITKIREQAHVAVTFSALPDLQLFGRITHIRALGEPDQDRQISYTALIALDTQDKRLRWNMSSLVSISTDEAAN